ncbi:alpha/beta hydrolase [Parasphingopyxis algicola]|uniref:alpha/beta hydrolase n=1 Tax=Parasphingopyxis algicola TaxID=2026624 RepID=UPI0015A35B88|nr:alpha/beta hydrolase [Parasphingopyxis algicola]QLC25744.1 alpha/beta hydrolase [Parasphingopyxis algicola]
MKNVLLATAAAATALSAAGTAEAATSVRVMFESGGERLVGDLYLPDGYEPGDRLPAVIVTGAWTTVKEQMPRRYAIEMADRGYAALAFDFRNWGQSEGDRRYYESPELKTEDILAAAEFLATRGEVDPARIGGLGICASAGYMAGAAARSSHIRSLALVAPWLHDRPLVDTIYGGADGVTMLIGESRTADEMYELSGRLSLVPAAGDEGSDAIMQGAPYYVDPDQGAIPEYDNHFNLASWEPWLTFDAISIADGLGEVPVQIVHSEAAAIPDGAQRFFDRLAGPKTELWLDGVTQFDFYDQDAAVIRSSDTVAQHFQQTLR